MSEVKEIERERRNTYTNDEYFKVVVLSKNEEEAIENSRWLTDYKRKLHRQDLLRCPYKQTSLVCYPRFKGDIQNSETKSFEAIAIFVEDEETFTELKEIVNENFHNLNAKLIVSNNKNAENWASQINSKFIARLSRTDVLDCLDNMDMDEFDNLVEKFNVYDEDKSGFITTNEMPRMVESLGENPNLDNLKQAILAFDTNQDGQISFQEFLSWWKLGRRDPFAFVKFYELGNYIDNQVKLVFNTVKLGKAMDNINEDANKKTTTADINLDTKTIEEYSSRLQLKLAIGGKAREEYCKNYLSRYNDKLEYNDDDFIDFAVFVQSGTIHGMSAKDYIEDFKNQIIDKLDKNYIPGIKNFLSNFMIVKVFTQDFSVNIRFEFKYDIQELLKAAFTDYLNITSWLTNNGKSPLSMDLILFNGKNLTDLTSEDSTLYDLLDKCELKIKFQAIKEKIRTLLVNLNPNFQEIGKFFQPVVISSSVKLKYEGNINQFNDSYSKEILDKKTTMFRDVVAFFKSNIPNELRKVMSRLEIGLNIIDTFASIQLFSENHWAD